MLLMVSSLSMVLVVLWHPALPAAVVPKMRMVFEDVPSFGVGQ